VVSRAFPLYNDSKSRQYLGRIVQNRLFRRSALEQLSSPEQLDSLMQVTSPRAWIALLGLGILVVAFVVWGYVGSVQVTTDGRGILIKGEGITTINAPSAGQVNDLYVGVNDTVEPGEIIARIQNANGIPEPVTSRLGGRVIETLVSADELVAAGQRMVILEPTGDDVDLEAIFYLPASEGKKVRPGMQVQVQPDTVSREEFGMMLGWVISVGEFTESRESMTRVLENDELTEYFFGLTDNAPLEIRVQFIPSRTTTTRYRWTTPQGPDIEIRSGTLAHATIILSDEAPIDLVFSARGS
jgi:hypothetical protein